MYVGHHTFVFASGIWSKPGLIEINGRFYITLSEDLKINNDYRNDVLGQGRDN